MTSKIKNLKFKLKEKGFILPFAVLLSGVILSIGLAVFNIILKEVILASSGRESQFAFYAADTGVECSLYWDSKYNIFPTSSDSVIDMKGATCAGTPIVFDSSIGTLDAATSTYTIWNENYCIKVTVAKYGYNSKIESEGYNTCNVLDPRRVERALRVLY